MVIYILCAIIILQGVAHYFERKDLYNRIMCKDIHEYKGIDTPAHKKALSAHEKAIEAWKKRGDK